MPETQPNKKDLSTLLSFAFKVKGFVPSWVKINIASVLKSEKKNV